MDLTSSQQETLNALLNAHETSDGAVSADDIAATVDLHPGSVRDQMQVLKSAGLVESVMGPTGGYEPTSRAFEVLDRERLEDVETLPLAHGYERIDATVASIDFTNVHHPTACRARVRFQQSVSRFTAGDPVVVGPTPRTGLVLAGEVDALDTAANELQLDVTRLDAPTERPRV